MNSLGVLGEGARGNIEPAHPDQNEQIVDEVKKRIAAGEFSRKVDRASLCGCIDGRCGGGLHVSSAGGTLSYAVMEDLTSSVSDSSTAELLRATVGVLTEKGELVGGHDDDHSPEDKTGCGANDNLDVTYGILAHNGDSIRSIAERMGLAISDELHDRLIQAAARRTSFSEPAELTQILKETPGSVFDTLNGKHSEIVIAVNKRANTTLDHQALADECGDNYGAFCVDVWAFEDAAKLFVSDDAPNSDEEINAKVVALAYFNIATAFALCGPHMEMMEIE